MEVVEITGFLGESGLQAHPLIFLHSMVWESAILGCDTGVTLRAKAFD